MELNQQTEILQSGKLYILLIRRRDKFLDKHCF